MGRRTAVAVVQDTDQIVGYVSGEIAAPVHPVAKRLRPVVAAPEPLFTDELHFGQVYLGCKRALDIAGSVFLAFVLSPAILFVMAVLSRSGPIFFAHERVGQGGQRFKVYKFRSMVPDADRVLAELLRSDATARQEWEADHKLRNDPRITHFGAFLRKSSMDELPQLWNVFKGEMSLVGPRPVIAEELRKYGRASRYYLAVKPGITGLWQVMGRNDVDYRRRIAMDRRYARTASLWGDIVVLFKTVKVVMMRSGAY